VKVSRRGNQPGFAARNCCFTGKCGFLAANTEWTVILKTVSFFHSCSNGLWELCKQRVPFTRGSLAAQPTINIPVRRTYVEVFETLT